MIRSLLLVVMARTSPPKPTLVFLVRHGRTPTTGKVLPGRAKGLHLGEVGIAQAEAVANQLSTWHDLQRDANKKASGITAVYASPMERTRETAAPIAKKLGLRVRRNKGLIEADFGDWTGKKLRDLYKKREWATVQQYPSGFRFPGGESFGEMQIRMVDAIQTLVATHAGEAIVAVSHADTIKAATAHALGTHLDLFQRIVVAPCSVTAIQYSSLGPRVLGLNTMGDPDNIGGIA